MKYIWVNLKNKICIFGLGYVGLPLALNLAKKFECIGFDIDKSKIESLSNGNSYIKHIPDDVIKRINNDGLFNSTSDFSKISDDRIEKCSISKTWKFRHLNKNISSNISNKPSFLTMNLFAQNNNIL